MPYQQSKVDSFAQQLVTCYEVVEELACESDRAEVLRVNVAKDVLHDLVRKL